MKEITTPTPVVIALKSGRLDARIGQTDIPNLESVNLNIRDDGEVSIEIRSYDEDQQKVTTHRLGNQAKRGNINITFDPGSQQLENERRTGG